MHNEKMADSRDMIGAHDAMRRQFGAMPVLIAGVQAGDAEGTAVVAGHVLMMVDFLHAHHTSEDDHVWPRLRERCPDDVAPLIETMDRQHAFIDDELKALAAGGRRWRASADAGDRDAVAAVAERLLPPLYEHLALEEQRILPLIDRHLTEREWKATVEASFGKVTFVRRLLMLGMALHGASEEQARLLRAAVPAVVWHAGRPLGTRLYRNHRERLAAASRGSDR
ncbi:MULTISPECIES: hemerythrin domain-containing protein [Actinoalloteichus]|uniref:Hemerythrin HHE cation binding domain-containing protein n=1 Tax=Actinoalloteichus fjordicus TaxID=1612552 RepID=A0AAC9LAD1_9PSEU|nr:MULTISPECIES: hemerythrin domain-containing protein [Actinoalloteichus]APU12745.1 hemerythrin HHE cation binding domain-containing protein [Actinoalloteichus fjordicus]APU18716.1 hemerythrin HHE cation binding domain-containing protein [Actinoalloteichus sp. GBA129-24]